MKKRKAADLLFAVCFVTMIFIPFLLLDTTEGLTSELENRALTAWPGLGFNKTYMEWYGHYAEDRVAFRDTAIMVNADLNYHLFGEFSEELHMAGKEGYIFPADEGYVQNYQRLNIDEELMDDLMTYLERTDAYVTERGGKFVFMICPNKSSVYGEYMPDAIHVDTTQKSTLDMAKEKLENLGISYVIPDAEFCDIKKTEQIYNVKYDCAHWNDLGAFYGLRMVNSLVHETYADIPVMEETDFARSTETVTELEFFATSSPIEDEIFKLTCTAASGIQVETDSARRADVTVEVGNNMAYFYNADAPCDRTILILHDSFLDNRESWYTYRYREVYFTSRVNYTHIQEYIDEIEPDVVLFELAERSFADDLTAYTQLGEIVFE